MKEGAALYYEGVGAGWHVSWRKHSMLVDACFPKGALIIAIHKTRVIEEIVVVVKGQCQEMSGSNAKESASVCTCIWGCLIDGTLQ